MKLRVCDSIASLREALRERRSTLGLVPTMGALHAGHRRLIECARSECGLVAVSIFVNPTQFNQAEDFERYPRTMESDLEICDSAGVDFVFAPSAAEMYPAGSQTTVEVGRVSRHLCGAFRPGHFQGVATVVLKLFQIVQPDRAYFGEKDAQQLSVIERMVQDLNVPVMIRPVATVREADGLALSSRNQRLDGSSRAIAPLLYKALMQAASAVNAGERESRVVRQRALDLLHQEPRFRVEYLEVVDPEMQPVACIQGPVRIATAVWLGGVRLIDNVAAGSR